MTSTGIRRRPNPDKTVEIQKLTRQLAYLCFIALAGCLTTPEQVRVTPEQAERVKTVGIMSLLNRQPHINYLSTSALESNFGAAVLEGWDVDRVVFEQLASRFKRNGFKVALIARDVPSLQLSESDSEWGYVNTEHIHEKLYDTGATNSLDMLIVVYPNVDADWVTKTNQNIRGYGLQKAFDSNAFAYASVFFEAIDIKNRFIAGKSEGLRFELLGENIWKPEYETADGPQTLNNHRQSTVQQIMTRLLREAIGSAARESGL